MSLFEFALPDVGEGLSEAEILTWRVEPGQQVARDEVIAEIETDKSTVELPTPVAGTIRELGAAEGDMVPVGAVVLVIETAEDAPTPETVRTPEQTVAGQGTSSPVETASAPPPARSRSRAAPAVRRLARERGIDLAGVHGSGPGGRITEADLDAAQAGAPSAPPQDTGSAAHGAQALSRSEVPELAGTVPLRGIRRAVARNLTQSWTTVPHITTFREVDASALVQARAELRGQLEREGVRVTYLPFFVAAAAQSLRRHPVVNASIDMTAETITRHEDVNVGVAVASPEGLLVTVLHDADRMSFRQLAKALEERVTAGREGTLQPQQSTGGTFTVSNTGAYGSWFGTPLVRMPEAAIAAFGAIRDAVVAVDGRPEVRPTLPLSVSADHRVLDGRDLGLFVQELQDLLENPIRLLAGGG